MLRRSVVTSLIFASFLLSSVILSLVSVSAQEQLSLSLDWGSYGTASSKLKNSQGITSNVDGHVFVADTGNSRVQKFSSDGALLSSFGTHGVTQGNFRFPEGIAVDGEGNVYVADTGNNRIQKFSATGAFIQTWGAYGSGEGKMKNPQGLTLDKENNVYVADTGNNRIQKFSSDGKFLNSIGSMGTSEGKMRYPEDVTVDSAGNQLISDTGNNRVQKFTSNGTFIHAWGTFGESDGNFNVPKGIATDKNGNFYVSDSGNNRVQKFYANGTFAAKAGTYGKFEGQMNFPTDVAVTDSGSVVILDSGNHRILSYITGNPDDYLALLNVGANGQPGVLDPALEVETVAEGLSLPTSIVFLGPDDFLILQKSDSQVRRMLNGVLLDEPVLDIGLGYFNGCMCGIASANHNNGTWYVFLYYYVLGVEEGDQIPVGAHLYRYDFVEGKLVNPKLMLYLPTSANAIHLGGKVLVGPDKNVYLTMGDMDGHKTRAQNVQEGPDADGTSAILRFDQNGGAVLDERSLGSDGLIRNYYAYGLRNSFGIDFDPITGLLWDTENGPDYGDEINLAQQGFNSGWNIVQGTDVQGTFDPSELVDYSGKGKYSEPEFEWIQPIGPTAIKFLDSDKLGKQYENDMFVGDVNNGHLYRFDLNESRTSLVLNGSLADGIANNLQERAQAVFGSGFLGITDVQVGPDGYPYVVSIASGKIYKVVAQDK